MIARSWLALLWTVLTVLSPVALPRAATSRGDAASAIAAQRWLRTDAGPRLEAAERGPAIVAGHIPLVSDLGAPSSVEITSALVRGLPSGSGSLPARDYLSDACVASPTLAVATWCDLVQCCRQRGMQLLRYATAPPVRA